jgi:hypothetical protein
VRTLPQNGGPLPIWGYDERKVGEVIDLRRRAVAGRSSGAQ